jgi:hypothetical protein
MIMVLPIAQSRNAMAMRKKNNFFCFSEPLKKSISRILRPLKA